MQKSTIIALVIAPLLGPVIWWLLMWPGRQVRDLLWRKLPEGRLRRVLLKDDGGKWIKPPVTPWDGFR